MEEVEEMRENDGSVFLFWIKLFVKRIRAEDDSIEVGFLFFSGIGWIVSFLVDGRDVCHARGVNL